MISNRHQANNRINSPTCHPNRYPSTYLFLSSAVLSVISRLKLGYIELKQSFSKVKHFDNPLLSTAASPFLSLEQCLYCL